MDTSAHKDTEGISTTLGSGVITGLRHMQPGREEQLIPDPLGIGNALCVYLEDGSGIRNDKQPNIRHAFGGPLYRWSFAGKVADATFLLSYSTE